MLKLRYKPTELDNRKYFLLALVVMQFGVVAEAKFGPSGRIVAIVLGMGLVGIGITQASLVVKLGAGLVRRLALLLLSILVIESIVVLRQPEMASAQNFGQRAICYLLFSGGMLSGGIQYDEKREGGPFYDFLIPLVILAFASSYVAQLDEIARYSVGRVTAGEDVSAVGLSYSLCLVAVLVFSQVTATTGIGARVLYVASLPLLIAGVVSAATRGPILAMIVVCVTMIAYRQRLTARGVIKASTAFAALFGAVYVAISSDEFYQRQLDLLVQRVQGASSYGTQDTSIDARGYIIGTYFDDYGKFVLVGWENYWGLYPHNLFLDFFIRYGALGFLLISAIYVTFIRGIWSERVRRRGRIEGALLAVSLFSFVAAQVSLTAEHLRFFWFGFGYLLSKWAQERIATPNPRVHLGAALC